MECIQMSDENIRNLERAVEADPNDDQAQMRLLAAKGRNTQRKLLVYWKLRHKENGLFANGRGELPCSPGDLSYYFSENGKSWSSKNILLKFIKKTKAGT